MKKILKTLRKKWAEYLLEILVITFGILLAFALNNWNEGRKNREMESAYLEDINKEFKENKIEFERRIEQHFQICEGLDSIIQLFPVTQENWLNIYEIIINTKGFHYPTFNATQSSVESFINSSNINLIQNKQLRNHLFSWKDILSDYSETEIIIRNFNLNVLRPFIINETTKDFKNGSTSFENFIENQPEFNGSIAKDGMKKFENLIIEKRKSYISIIDVNKKLDNQAELVGQTINSIITLTEPHTKD